MTTTAQAEDLGSFRRRAAAWLAANLPPLVDGSDPFDRLDEDDAVARARWLQRTLFEGGFAGLVFPPEYGGQGLTPEHQRIFTRESAGYESPLRFNMSTLAIIAPTLLEFGTEDQKRRHIPAMLRGDELWAQFLSEPTGGSNLAGAVTRATRDGESWVIDGSKIWSSGAHLRDRALCLARSNWDVPKHRGLTMFIIDIRQSGVEVRRIRQADGSAEFCQEFLTDVVVPETNVVGEVDDGWAVASRMLHHERNAVGGSTVYAGRITGRRRGVGGARRQQNLVALAKENGRAGDPVARQLVAEAHVLATVRGQLIGRVTAGVRRRQLPGAAAAVLKLFTSTAAARLHTIGLELAGPTAVVGRAGERSASPCVGSSGPLPAGAGPIGIGLQFLTRQATCIAGGSNEMQRNNISERALDMPRERTPDHDIPFSEVPRGPGRPTAG